MLVWCFGSMWTKEQVALHGQAARHLAEIKDEVFALLRAGAFSSEYAAHQFILKDYGRRGLVTTFTPIVAFDAHAAIPHYFPTKRSAKFAGAKLVLIDIWAKVNTPKAPYADITWTASVGKPTVKAAEVFRTVIAARDAAVSFLRRQLKQQSIPTGAEVDAVANGVIRKAGYGRYLKHRTGHCIGTTSPHGLWKNVSRANNEPLQRGLGYTIEPGIYIDGVLGVRSEIDVLITENFELVVTTKRQREFVRL